MGWLVLLFTLIPLILLMVFKPFITRKTESFGVPIPEECYRHPEIVRLRKKYVLQMALLGGIVFVLALLLSFRVDENGLAILLTAVICLFLLVSFGCNLFFHSKMKALKAESDWQQTNLEAKDVNTIFRDPNVTFSNGWFWIPLLITAGTIIIIFIWYDQVPERIPMRYDLAGNVTHWAEKSYRKLLIFPVMQLFMIGLFVFINGRLRGNKRHIDTTKRPNIVSRRRWSGYLIATGTAVVVMSSALQLSFLQIVDQEMIIVPILIIIATLIAGAVMLVLTTGQGGKRSWNKDKDEQK